jgi:hypothetical protein
MDSLHTIISAKNMDAPEEIERIKEFVRRKYDSETSVKLSEKCITLVVPSAALAGALRHDLATLQALTDSEKNITIRIGTL